MTLEETPLDAIYQEIRGAIEARVYYAAITVSVALPDICCTLEGNVPTSWVTYKDWFKRWAARHFSVFGADECYSLRCGVMHNGRFMGGKIKYSEFDRIVFNLPETSNMFHDCSMDTRSGGGSYILGLNVDDFCNSMIAAANDWYAANASDKTVVNNMDTLVQYRPHGFENFSHGIPVIA